MPTAACDNTINYSIKLYLLRVLSLQSSPKRGMKHAHRARVISKPNSIALKRYWEMHYNNIALVHLRRRLD